MAQGAQGRARRAQDVERCPVCAHPLLQLTRGRRRRHCSPACRQVAYRRRRDGEKKRALVTLIEADARALLPTLPAESVDLIVTDPPYEFERGATYFRVWFEVLPEGEWPALFSELYRVLKWDRHAYVFCDWPTLSIFIAAAEQAAFRVQKPLVWDKDWLGLGSGAWRSRYEFILWFEKGSRPGNSHSLPDVLRFRRPHRGYPTEKPVELLKTLIGQASLPGEQVIDPFCGSGNVGLAARRLGRRALLCDVHADFAARRLRLATVSFDASPT
jgi:site-specific DNA-methyltransferase (adenine-specific)